MQAKEMDIPVPWGVIKAKVWGDPHPVPVLLLHGFQDNKNTFDRLIPLLPRRQYISLDLPGHGHSSHFPGHAPLSSMEFVFALKLAIDHLQPSSFVLMGHSYGGQVSVFYTSLYPEKVRKLIQLDTVTFRTKEPYELREYILEHFEKMERVYQKAQTSQPPEYTFEEAVQKMIDIRNFPITEEGAKILISGCITPASGQKYFITTDQKLKGAMTPFMSEKMVQEFIEAEPITCPHLAIFSKTTAIYHRMKSKLIMEEFRKNRLYEEHLVEGYHDMHLTEPEKVAPIISEFLNRPEAAKL